MLKMPNINQLAISGVIEGQPVCRDGFVELTIACRRNFRDKDGEWVEEISYVTAHVKSEPIESRAGIGDAAFRDRWLRACLCSLRAASALLRQPMTASTWRYATSKCSTSTTSTTSRSRA